LNRQAARSPQPLSEDTYAVLAAALRFAAESGGAFDPCVAPRLREWGYLPRVDEVGMRHGLPAGGGSPERTAKAWKAIELMPDHRVRFHHPLEVDLGG